MRNTIFVLALGIGAVVHFTYRLFPSLTSISSGARLDAPYNPAVRPYYLESTTSGPSVRPAVWTEISPSDSLSCRERLVRRTGGATDFEDTACENLGEPTARGIGAPSCHEIASVLGRYCRF